MELRFAYYWSGRVNNFGDQLSPLLLEHFGQTSTQWADPLLADIVSTGSVLDVLPQRGWGGVVAGSGKLHERTRTDLTNADVLGVRGYLTASQVKMRPTQRHNLVIGDPALLVDELVPVQRGKHPLGLIAHWSDIQRALYRKYIHLKPLVIDPTDDPITVLEQIGSCERIITSTLHGVIAADAWGIPRQAEPFPNMYHPYEGGPFKFLDHSSALGMPLRWGEWQTAPRQVVENIQSQLFDMFRSIKKVSRVS